MFKARDLLSRFPEVAFAAALIAVILLLAARSNIVFQRFGILLVPVAVMSMVWLWYDRRGLTRLSELAYYPMMFLVVGMSILVLSYLVVDPALPLHDQALANLDAALLFYWPDWLTFYRTHPQYQPILQWAYESFTIQIYGSAFFFALTGKQSRNKELLRLAIISSVMTIVIFHGFPVLGPFFYFSVAPRMQSVLHLPHLLAGEPMMLTPFDLQGLISFPSFHTVMAITFMYVHRKQGWLTWAMVLLNLTMLVATIMCGAHYLVDLLGGMVVTAISIALVRMMMPAQEENLVTPLPASPV